MSLTKATYSMINGAPVNVLDYGADPTGTNDSTSAFQAAVNAVQANSAGYSSPYVTIVIPYGTYQISGSTGVNINYNTNVLQVCFESESGARLVGTGSNICFNFNLGGYRNILKKIDFTNFGTAVVFSTNNRDTSYLKVENCNSYSNSLFIDTVSYAATRSTMIEITGCLVENTPTAINAYNDKLTITDCWFYEPLNSFPAMLYLSGDGNVTLKDCFFIPNSTQISPVANARWIDFVSDTANGTSGDRSLKCLNIFGCRMSLESARPFIWTFDNGAAPNGANQISSISITDSYIGGTGGYPVVTYKTLYPGSVNLRNCKVYASPYIVAVDSANTTYPVPSYCAGSTVNITYHTIMVDEATRLSQNNTNNASGIIDPLLTPFYYDTTSQTSKYRTTFPGQAIDYRIPATTVTAGTSVKVSFPIFFDYNPAVSSRDICSFLLVTVSDAGGSSPSYRAQATTLVTVTGGHSGSNDVKILNSTTLQDAQGGNPLSYSAVPTIFWGSGNTGSGQVIYSGSGNPQEYVTAVWNSSNASVSWAYIVPLSGIRSNEPSLTQYGNW